MVALSFGTAQTLLLLAAPWLLPKGIRLVRSFLSPSPAGTRTPLHPAYRHPSRPADSPSRAHFRLLLISLALSLAVFTLLSAPHNLFLSLSAPQSTLQSFFPALRTPLDLRLATETLARAWSVRMGRELGDDELGLLGRLQTLDARAVYVAYGTTPLMHCSWCRPGEGLDYLLMLAPGLGLEYLLVLAVTGLLLGGGRKHWRTWMVVALLAGGVTEAYMRVNWAGPRAGASVMMLHSTLHLLRYTYFSLLLLVAYILPPARVSHPNSTASLISPAILNILNQSETLLNRIRATSVERMAILHNREPRENVVEFWSSAENESELARADPAVSKAFKEGEKGAQEFAEWVERAFAVRTPSSLQEVATESAAV